MICPVSIPQNLRRILRVLLWIVVSLVSLVIIISLLLFIPSVQKSITTKATNVISKKAGMNVEVGSIHIAFPKAIKIGGIFIEDQEFDTLLYCNQIKIDADFIPLITRKINVDFLLIEGLKANVYKNKSDSLFNISPLLEVFSAIDNPPHEKSNSEWEIAFEEIELRNIQAEYKNLSDSSALFLNLGHLAVSANSANISSRQFDLEKISLRKTSMSIIVNNGNQLNTEKSEQDIKLPFDLKLVELNLDEIHIDIKSVDGDLGLQADLHQASVKPHNIDLNTFDINLDDLAVEGIDVALQIMPQDSSETMYQSIQIKENSVKDPFAFGNFPGNIFVNQIKLANTFYKMDIGSDARDSSGIDYRHMAFMNFNLLADSAYFNKNATGITVRELRVKEISGSEISQVKGRFSLDNQAIQAIDLMLSTPSSRISGTASLAYPSLRQIGENSEQLYINSDINGSINISEISPFSPIVNQFPILDKLDQVEIDNFIVNGSLDNLYLEDLSMSFGDSTILKANGSIEGLPSNDLHILFELDTLLTSVGDVEFILPDTLLPARIDLPDILGLNASLIYQPNFMDFKAKMNTNYGNIHATAQLFGDELSTDFHLQALDVGSLLSDSIYGELMLDGELHATNADGSFHFLNSNIDIQSLSFDGATYGNIKINVEKKNEVFSLYSSIDDSLLSFVANGEAIFQEASNHYNLNINVGHADLQGMNLINEYFVIAGDININTDYTSIDDVEGIFILSDIHLSNSVGNYKISEMKLISDFKEDYTNFNFTSDIFNSSLTGNTKIGELKPALSKYLNGYFEIPDSLLGEKEFHFNFEMSLNKPDFFTNFLIPDLSEFDISHCTAAYDGSHDLFEVDLRVTQLVYEDWRASGLSFLLASKGDSIISNIEMEQLLYDSIFLQNITLSTRFIEQNAGISLTVHDDVPGIKYGIETNVAFHDSSYIITLNPEKLIINHRPWTVNPDNKVLIKNGNIKASAVMLSNGTQKINLGSLENHLKLDFEQFDIKNLTEVFSNEEEILGGRLNGHLDAIDLFGALEVESELDIIDLSYGNEKLGNLNASFNYNSQEAMNYTLDLTNDKNSMNLVGMMDYSREYPGIDANLRIDIAEAEKFSGLLEEYLSHLSGGINGRLLINGKLASPRLSGELAFRDLSIKQSSLNTFLATNGSVSIQENVIEFVDFNVQDSLKNKISIKGDIDVGKINDPIFNLELSTPEFMLVNSKEEKNKTIVGKLLLGMDVDVKGKLSNLVVNSAFNVNKKTNIMYVMPGKDLQLITDKGIVVFTDPERKSALDLNIDQSQFIADSLISMIKGIDLTVNIKIDPQAQFRIYVDPNSGDITFFRLNGNLQYKYNDVQRGYLTGLVALREGYYELSFYGLVKKKFVYDPGSTISWSGDVMDGEIIFSARHKVVTNSVGLVSNEISSAEKSKYNQRLPYEVILRISDQLSYPKISFGIDLPDQYKNDNPTLASKITMLEGPGMESERNKQVFALLVGGTFIPESPDVNEGSSNSNFATTAARNSVNSIMTQQLNNLTDQFIKGFDVSMGVNTIEEVSEKDSRSRTQLDVKVSKNLFSDRVSVEVESHIDLEGENSNPGTQSTAGMTEFAVSYQITKSGNYRIKAFRENAWDIFDGEIQNSGFAFIFIKEFDRKRKASDNANDQIETEYKQKNSSTPQE